MCSKVIKNIIGTKQDPQMRKGKQEFLPEIIRKNIKWGYISKKYIL
jgi:hypothetical protein